MKTPSYHWSFRPRFRARALGWRGSSLAMQRLKEALAEIKAVHRTEPALAAEGALLLLERIWPAFQAVDTSNGSLGNAVNKSVGLNDSPAAIARAAEAILLAAGRSEDAYRRYALAANQAGTHLATYRAIKKKYPEKAARDILDDLIASTPDDPGRWFATAKGLGFLDLAADLARRSPVDIATLLRAARDHLDQAPEFALAAATAALHWMAKGRFYEIKALEVWQARSQALGAATALGRREQTQALIARLIQDEATDSFVRKQLRQVF